MATRRRRTSRTSRSTTRRRTSTRRYTTRRRRPKLATTLGAAVALALVYAWQRLPWYVTAGIAAAAVALVVIWFLWSRRGDIYDEMQARREDGPADGAGAA